MSISVVSKGFYAIEVKRIPQTNTKPERVQLKCDGMRVVYSFPTEADTLAEAVHNVLPHFISNMNVAVFRNVKRWDLYAIKHSHVLIPAEYNQDGN